MTPLNLESVKADYPASINKNSHLVVSQDSVVLHRVLGFAYTVRGVSGKLCVCEGVYKENVTLAILLTRISFTNKSYCHFTDQGTC